MMGTASARPQDDVTAGPILETGPIGSLFASQRARQIIEPLLRGVSYSAVVSETHILAAKKPDILKCTGESILMSVADCLRHQLVFGETAHMVPFNTKVKYFDADRNEREKWEWRAQFIVGWKGAIELVVRSGSARDVDAQCVYANELTHADERKNFWYREGGDPDVNHYPVLRREQRGELVGAYAVARLNQSQKKVVWMDVSEIDELRKTYSKQHNKGTLEPWYARKTLVLQVCNRLPRNAKLDAALAIIRHDESLESVEEISAEVSTSQPRMLTEGAARRVEIAQRDRMPVGMSDEDRIEAANRELAFGLSDVEDDPRPSRRVPF